jgi:hypothetical protein
MCSLSPGDQFIGAMKFFRFTTAEAASKMTCDVPRELKNDGQKE